MSDKKPKKKFSVRLKTYEFDVEKLDGSVAEYKLRELTGDGRDMYLNMEKAMTAATKDGGREIKDYTNVCANLLSLCAYDENDKIVTPDVIQTWPAAMQMELFLEAKKLSGLDAVQAKAEAKNE